jgi:glycosyltransferase involved in cell wall biosynthesis
VIPRAVELSDGGAGTTERRLLFVSPVIPAPLDRGQNVRIHNLVMGLAPHFRITLVVPEGPELAEQSPLWSAVEQVIAVPAATSRATPRDLLRFMLRHRTLVRPGVVTWLQPYQDAVDRLSLDRYSAVWVERLGLARLFNGVARRVVVDMDDLEHRKWARELRLRVRSGPVRTSAMRLYYASRFFLHEVVLAHRYGRCAVASATDAAYLRRWRLGNSALLPNGATVGNHVRRNPGSPLGPRASGRVVFLGNLGYGPNVDALIHFEESIRPALAERGVIADLSVIGPGVTDALKAQFSRVDFRGFVPDLADALRHFDVCVVPLRLGGGTKLKVLDAMASGTPVVMTTVGAEGLNVTPGVHAMVADSPEDFTGAVVGLLEDGDLARRLGERGRVLVESEYSWRSVQERAIALVSAVLDR